MPKSVVIIAMSMAAILFGAAALQKGAPSTQPAVTLKVGNAAPALVPATTWLTAAGQDSIPTAFVIDKETKIAWIGHPLELEPVLKALEAGTFDAK